MPGVVKTLDPLHPDVVLHPLRALSTLPNGHIENPESPRMIRLWDSWLATSITGGDVEVARAHLLVSSLEHGQEWRLWPTGILWGVGP